MLQLLPEAIQQKIAAYMAPEDRALRVAGMHLLLHQLRLHGLEQKVTLEDLAYDAWGKPGFGKRPVHCSMAHAGRLALCAFTRVDGPVGIDAELLRPLQLDDVTDYLTTEEARLLEQQPDTRLFFDLWTRKEAVLKASGEGIGRPFAEVAALRSPVALNGRSWYWQRIAIDPAYSVHLAVAVPDGTVQVQEVLL